MADTPRSLAIAPHLAILSVGYVTFAYASVPDAVRARYGVSFAALGLLMSAVLFAFGVVQLLGGRLVDRTSTIRVLATATAVQGLAALALDAAPTFGALVALRALWGLAGGIVLLTGVTHLARFYTGPAATRQQGVFGGMITVGGAAAFVVAPRVVAATGWVGVHAVGALPAAVAVALTLYGGRVPSARAAARGRGDRLRPRELLAVPPIPGSAVWLAGVCYVAVIGGYISLSTFISSYFADMGVTDSVDWAVLLMASVGRMGGGVLVEEYGADDARTIVVAMLAAAAGFLGLTAFGGPALLVLPLVTMIAVSSPFGAVFNAAADAAGDEEHAAGLAVVIAMGNFAGMLFPAMTGIVREVTGSYDGAFAVISVTCLVGAVAGGLVGRSVRRRAV
jgi:nitrate/nitrite transporter NarK